VGSEEEIGVKLRDLPIFPSSTTLAGANALSTPRLGGGVP
jgi:hypothetical protein